MTNLFVIGAPRCGTTSLNWWLSQHPSVLTSTPKEVRYFDNNYHKGEDWYLNHFKRSLSSTHTALVDCNPHYCYVNFVAERIANDFPSAKILQVVRNPADRIFSFWKLFANMRPGRIDPDFSNFVDQAIKEFDPKRFELEGHYLPYLDQAGTVYSNFIFESGNYLSNGRRFQTAMKGKSSGMKLATFEELTCESEQFMGRMFEWLEVEYHKINLNKASINETWPAKNKRQLSSKDQVEMKDSDREKIYSMFFPMVRVMSEMMSFDFIDLWGMKK